MRLLNGGAPTPRDEIRDQILPFFLRCYDRADGYGFWAAIEKVAGAFLGWFHLRPDEGAPVDQPELGCRLRRSAWGKGYGTEGSRALIRTGFAELGARRVVAVTDGEHRASRRVMAKAGMRPARTYRLTPERLVSFGITDPAQFVVLFDGDDVEYAITRAEWEPQDAAGRAPGP